jgi:hypothetical protein
VTNRGFRNNDFRGRRSTIWAYPVYVGGYYGVGGYYDAYTPPAEQQQPNVTVINNTPPAAPAQPVVINQYFNSPPPTTQDQPEESSLRIYQQRPSPAQAATENAAPEPRSYLIAYKDHSVYSALAYWVEDHTLHYVTMQNTHNQADISLIDVEFTKKLNQDRNMSFSLRGPGLAPGD